MSKLYQTCTK